MRLSSIAAVAGEGGWYVDDKPAFAARASLEHYLVTGSPLTPGFEQVREPGQIISVSIKLSDGTVAVGEGGSVTYAGIAGRDPVFRACSGISTVEEHISPAFAGAPVSDFRTLEQKLVGLSEQHGGFHTAVLYATSQALLQAVATARRIPAASVIADEYGLAIGPRDPKVAVQTGADRYSGVDKALYRQIDVLPHGLIKSVGDDFGHQGEKLLDYARWIMARIEQHQPRPDYHPCIHFDCYGTIGRAFDNDIRTMAEYIERLAAVVSPLQLQIEAPVEAATQAQQVELMAQLRRALAELPEPVPQIIADEWCNTVADVELFASAGAADLIQIKMPDLGPLGDSIRAALICRKHGVGAYMGGSCNETDISARTAVQVAVAVGADQILARPGMGIDEAVCITRNELRRLRHLLA